MNHRNPKNFYTHLYIVHHLKETITGIVLNYNKGYDLCITLYHFFYVTLILHPLTRQ